MSNKRVGVSGDSGLEESEALAGPDAGAPRGKPGRAHAQDPAQHCWRESCIHIVEARHLRLLGTSRLSQLSPGVGNGELVRHGPLVERSPLCPRLTFPALLLPLGFALRSASGPAHSRERWLVGDSGFRN